MMKKRLWFVIFILLSYSFAFSQSYPSLEWIQTYSSGAGRDITETQDGSFVIVGSSAVPHWTSGDLIYVRIDSDGSEILSVTNSDVEGCAFSLVEDEENNFYISGRANNLAYLEKTDSEFNSFFSTTFPSVYFQSDVVELFHNSLLISAQGVYGHILCADFMGNPYWDYYYPADHNIWGDYQNSYCTEIEVLDDGHIMIGGWYESYMVGDQISSNFLIKADSLGNEIWFADRYVFSGTGNNRTKFLITEEGDFVVTVCNNEVNKISSDGELLWVFDDLDYPCTFSSIQQYTAGNNRFYYVIGNISDNEFCLVKIDDSGNLIWEQVLDFESNAFIYDFVITQDGGFLLAGQSSDQFSVFKLSRDETLSEETEIFYSVILKQNFPNPFNPFTEISFSVSAPNKFELSVYNLRGQRIKKLFEGFCYPGEYSYSWSGTDESNLEVSSGIYLFKLISDNGVEAHRKCLLLK